MTSLCCLEWMWCLRITCEKINWVNFLATDLALPLLIKISLYTGCSIIAHQGPRPSGQGYVAEATTAQVSDIFNSNLDGYCCHCCFCFIKTPASATCTTDSIQTLTHSCYLVAHIPHSFNYVIPCYMLYIIRTTN